MAITPSPNPETIEVLLDTTWRLVAGENARTEDLDRKATSLATFAALVASLTATLGTAFLTGLDSVWTLAIFAVGVGLLGSSVVAAVAVLLPKEHLTLSIGYVRRLPTWSEILKPPEQVRGETMAGLSEVIARERELNQRKARLVQIALTLLQAGLGVVVIEALILGAREI